MEKVEILNSFFASILTSKMDLQESQAPKTGGRSGARKIPLVEDDQVREYLSKLVICKSMGHDGVCIHEAEQAV